MLILMLLRFTLTISYDYACVYAYVYVTSLNEPLAPPGCNYSNVLCWNGKVEFKVRAGSFRLNTVCSVTKGAFKLNWDLKQSKLGLGSKLHSSQRLNFANDAWYVQLVPRSS